jgi:ELWxxDGT repeat protein
VYFSADNGTDGYELWKSSGSGATMVADINDTAGEGSDPNSLLAVGNTIYFSAYNQSGGRELMHATASGYTGYFDISAGLDSSGPNYLTDFNGQLYFTASTADAGNELWRVNSSGTAAERVADINPGAGSSTPYSLTPIGDWLYFTANDGASGWELWRTNGITTELVKDISAGAGDSYTVGFTERNGVIFFQAYSGSVWTIFQTTGTEASTVEAVTSTGTNPYIGCECDSPVVFAGNRAFSYMGNNEFGWEVAFFDLSLPNTNRSGSGFLTALLIGAALTAAAGLTVRVREAKRQ